MPGAQLGQEREKRDLIREIRVIPRGKGEPVVLEIVGDLAALMA